MARGVVKDIKKGMKGKLFNIPNDIVWAKKKGGHGRNPVREKAYNELLEKYEDIFDTIYEASKEYGVAMVSTSLNDIKREFKFDVKESMGGRDGKAIRYIPIFANVKVGDELRDIRFNDIWLLYIKKKLGLDKVGRGYGMRINKIKVYIGGKEAYLYVFYSTKFFEDACDKYGIEMDKTRDATMKKLLEKLLSS